MVIFNRNAKRAFWELAIGIAAATAAFAQVGSGGVFRAAGERFTLERVVSGLEYPWALAFLPGGGFLVTERPGRFALFAADLSRRSIRAEPVPDASGQGGLLDLALHPEFARNGLVYWTFSESGRGGSSTALARGGLEGETLKDVQTLWRRGWPSRATTAGSGSPSTDPGAATR